MSVQISDKQLEDLTHCLETVIAGNTDEEDAALIETLYDDLCALALEHNVQEDE